MLRLALKSLSYRRGSVGLTLVAIALALVMVVLGGRLSEGVKNGLYSGSRGVDLVVARSAGDVQIVMQALYQIGPGGAGMGPDDQALVAALDDIAWVVPVALGDSHRGLPVVATTPAYLERVADANGQPIAFAAGHWADEWTAVVLGARAAKQLGYALGHSVTLSHGSGTGLERGHEQVLTVSGILAPTGTPLDNRVLVSLEADRLLNADPITGAVAEQGPVTALLVGAKRKVGVFRIQRDLERLTDGRLRAVIPGAALTQLWQLVGVVQAATQVLSGLMLGFAALTLVTLALMNWRQRRRECAVLRAMGSPFGFAVGAHVVEGIIVAAASIALAVVATAVGFEWISAWVLDEYGLLIAPAGGVAEWLVYGAATLLAVAATVLPLLISWRGAIASGLTETQ